MNVYKFSLPEGWNLKMDCYGAEAHIFATINGDCLQSICQAILGETLTLRRGILGTSLIVRTTGPVEVYDLVPRIRRLARQYRVDYTELNQNLRHLEGMPLNPATMSMVQEQARRTFNETRDRIHRESLRELSERERLHNHTYDTILGNIRVNEAMPPDQIAVIPQFATTRLVTTTSGQYTVRDNGMVYRSDTGEQMQILPNGSIVNIHGLA